MSNTLNVKGQLMDLSVPRVMGILNATPDSFYAESRQQTEKQIAEQAGKMLDEGADIIDIGACSTRPQSVPASEEEERERLRLALATIRNNFPEAVVSVDTFRCNIARMAVEEYGVDIINDVSPTPQMFHMVSRLCVPYIITSSEPTLERMLMTFAKQVQQLHDLGQKDIILDPGFGFGKSLEQNYGVLNHLEQLEVMGLPILAGMSRKSMIFNALGTTPEKALNGTTVVNTIALLKGASILRVHDVKEAVACCKLTTLTKQSQ